MIIQRSYRIENEFHGDWKKEEEDEVKEIFKEIEDKPYENTELQNLEYFIRTIAKEFQLKNIAIDIVKNNKNEYYLILEKEKYLASLIIAEPIFAPYKNICFEVYRVSDEKIILFYYDNENTTLQQNVEQIDKMLDKFIEIN